MMQVSYTEQEIELVQADNLGVADLLREAAAQIEIHVTTVEGVTVELGVEGKNSVRIYVGEWDV